MAPDRAMRLIDQQAITYAGRVQRGEINSSAVESLLNQDACTFADSYEIGREVFRRGMSIYNAAIGVDHGN